MAAERTFSIIRNIIEQKKLITSTKIDSTIKAIISRILDKNSEFSIKIIRYLNAIRLDYTLKRLEYYNRKAYSSILSKFYKELLVV